MKRTVVTNFEISVFINDANILIAINVEVRYEFACQTVWMFLLLQLFYFIKYLHSDYGLTGAAFHTVFY